MEEVSRGQGGEIVPEFFVQLLLKGLTVKVLLKLIWVLPVFLAAAFLEGGARPFILDDSVEETPSFLP